MFSSSKGRLPVSSAYKMTPQDQMSASAPIYCEFRDVTQMVSFSFSFFFLFSQQTQTRRGKERGKLPSYLMPLMISGLA